MADGHSTSYSASRRCAATDGRDHPGGYAGEESKCWNGWKRPPGARFLLVLASVVVVVAGLKLAADVLVLFFLALFLAVLTLPVMMWLRRYRVPSPLAIMLSVLVMVAGFGVIILLASQSFAEFQARYPAYELRFTILWGNWAERIQAVELPVVGDIFAQIPDVFDLSAALDLATGTVQRVLGFVTDTFLVILIMVFILAEATIFPHKFRAALGPTAGSSTRLTKIVREVQTYLGIKTLVSLATGVTIGAFAALIQLDFPILLGLIGFLLNYIPTIGSIIASIPAVVLALVMFGPGPSIGVALVYLAINTVVGNVIEPTLMGRRLGLSTLVVVLSLVFWGWVWGPLGMFLSVPLTMMVKIMLENTPDLRWMAVLLDKGAPDTASIRGTRFAAARVPAGSGGRWRAVGFGRPGSRA